MKQITKFLFTAAALFAASSVAAKEAKPAVAAETKNNHEQICKTNLIAAESFLTANAKEKGGPFNPEVQH